MNILPQEILNKYNLVAPMLLRSYGLENKLKFEKNKKEKKYIKKQHLKQAIQFLFT